MQDFQFEARTSMWIVYLRFMLLYIGLAGTAEMSDPLNESEGLIIAVLLQWKAV